MNSLIRSISNLFIFASFIWLLNTIFFHSNEVIVYILKKACQSLKVFFYIQKVCKFVKKININK